MLRALALTVVALLVAAAPAAAAKPFRATIAELSPSVRDAMTPSVWRSGCPAGLDDLRLVTLRHYGFSGKVGKGKLVVHRAAANDVVRAFRRMYAARFPIRKMRPIEHYGGSDSASIEDDNTSAFNCRKVTGGTGWSEHAYGRAIDINPIENPYVSSGRTEHAKSEPYLDRSDRRPGMAVPGRALVRAFDLVGWGWGGRWKGSVKDYQHFSSTGR
ncbi:MAG: M15 family metallopeptidase [Solirubrobacteraceae bacterium]|nr:M15 family metallopeptidase [Solirubrobacteraceae bacterium]